MKHLFLVVVITLLTNATWAQEEPTSYSENQNSVTEDTEVVTDKEMSETEKQLDELHRRAVENRKTPGPTATQEKKPATTKDSTGEAKSSAHTLGAFAQLSLIDLIAPIKYGLSGFYNFRGHHIEAEYLTRQMSVPLIITDIGEITDHRLTMRLRNFTRGGRFNWYAGVTYFTFDAKLGSDFINAVTPGSPVPDYDIIHHRALGVDLGIGHRWEVADNFVFGVDWVGISQPLITLQKKVPFLDASNNSSARDKIESAMNIVAYTPRIYILKLSVGYVF